MKTIDNYLDEVCRHIANAPCRRAVRRELKNHMEDIIDAALADGAGQEEAVCRAIDKMGMRGRQAVGLIHSFPSGLIISSSYMFQQFSFCIPPLAQP